MEHDLYIILASIEDKVSYLVSELEKAKQKDGGEKDISNEEEKQE